MRERFMAALLVEEGSIITPHKGEGKTSSRQVPAFDRDLEAGDKCE
jgi:hypothetical protein